MNTIYTLIKEEEQRQSEQISLIASENYASQAVRAAVGSRLSNKYSEGYPGKRYYAGNTVIDRIENAARDEAKRAFSTDYHVNVQPYSGSPANLAAYLSVVKPGDTVMSLSLAHGGHLTHGHAVSLTGSLYNFVHYEVSPQTEQLDYESVRAVAEECRPKLIVCGYTSYPMQIDFSAFSTIARLTGSLLMVDMAHIAGLIAGGAYPSPFGLADIITSSTHKTLRGPRGGLIFCKPELAQAVDRAVFPGIQGGPHDHSVAAKAVAFLEAQTSEFKEYAGNVVKNAQSLASALASYGIRLQAGGTQSHLLVADVRSYGISGKEAQSRLESIGIIANMNMIPFDTGTPLNPSGVRLGTAAVTTRGMGEDDMNVLADIIHSCLKGSTDYTALADSVRTLASTYPIP